MNITYFLNKSSVILSGGEPLKFLFSQDLPEPQSKDLVRTSEGLKKGDMMSLRKESPSPIAPKRANSPRADKARGVSYMRSRNNTRSFDCGSGSFFDQAISPASPPLRMTDCFYAFTRKGAAQ